MSFRDDLLAHGWCQGSLIREQDNVQFAPHLTNIDLPEGYRLIVISHTCDMVHADLGKEPVAEVLLVAVAPGKPNGSVTSCRSPRILHMPLTCDDGEIRHVQAKRINVRQVPRELFQHIQPDTTSQLDERGLATLERWLTLRYSRAELPDAFVERLRPALDHMKAALKPLAHEIDSIYMAINSEVDLPTGEPYNVTLFGIMQIEDFEQPGVKAQAETAMAAVAAAMQGCEGIEVLDSDVVSAAEFSLDHVRHAILMNFDYVSLAADPLVPAPGAA